MGKVQRSQAYLRKQKMLLVLPMLVIPFLTMAFWALGGGKGNINNGSPGKTIGLNLNLPDSKTKEEKLRDKLSFYDQAQRDSMKLEEMIQNDPYYKREALVVQPEIQEIANETASKYNQSLNASPYSSSTRRNPEEEIMQRVSLLQKELNKPKDIKDKTSTLFDPYAKQQSPQFSDDMNRLENLMMTLNNPNAEDQDLQQLGGMLDKILDIQHPERVNERIKEKSIINKDKIYGVSKTPSVKRVSLLDTSKKKPFSEHGFFHADNESDATMANAIDAVIHENQTLVNGAVVKLRLLNDVYVSGLLISRGAFIYGTCILNDERLQIEISSVRSENSLFPVKLEVYDVDGLPGIYIPGSNTRDVSKQTADNSLQLLELTTMDPSLKAQLAASGINAAKNLISKKTKLVKVTVKAGYRIFLKDKKTDQ